METILGMNECHYCNVNKSLYETKHWGVILYNDQAYLGRCVVYAKRHVGDLADLTRNELLDFQKILTDLENALRASFKPDVFNWACLMNHAYKSVNPDPHVHWHVIPRYRKPVKFSGLIFTDTEFGEPHDWKREFKTSPEVRNDIIAKLKNNLKY